MSQESGQQQGRRVSFLMPYIDFCFMLIIIFVGMLSIAYFNPPGQTDVEVKKPARRTDMIGQNEPLPEGVTVTNTGAGNDMPQGAPYPLTSNSTAEMPFQDAHGRPAAVTNPGTGRALSAARTGAAEQPGQSAASRGGTRTGPAGTQSTQQPRGASTTRTWPAGATAAPHTPQATGTMQPQPSADVKKLLEQIEQLKKNQRTGPEGKGETNNLYLDLRSNK